MPNYWDRKPRDPKPLGVVVVILVILVVLDVTLSFCSSNAREPSHPKPGLHAAIR